MKKFNLKKMATRLSIYLAVFFTATPLLAFNVSSQSLTNVKVSIFLDNANLVDIFNTIEKQTDFNFVYDSRIESIKTPISINAKTISVKKVLDILKSKVAIDFKQINNSISVVVIDKNRANSKNAVQKKITGRVTDKSGMPLPGVTIQIKGSNKGTTTDFEGNYSVIANSNDILIFSFLGFKTKEISVGENKVINVQLEEGSETLDEIVLIGYGESTKGKFNGSVSKIKSKKINDFSSANFEQALAGNVAGVQIAGNGKNPGENSVIQIRGINTLTAGTNPLLVVDGVPLTEGTSLSSINTQDIASVSILKDAASASIYGSRASNGVILITTKKGKKGSLKITYDTYLGVQDRIDKFELVDAYDYALFDNDARNFGYLSGGSGRSITDNNATRLANGGNKRSLIQDFLPAYLNRQQGLTNTNWLNHVFRTALQQNHYLNLSGGSEKSDYYISFGYFDQENIIVSSDYKRYTNNIKIDSEINDYINFGVTTNISLVNANPTGEAGWSNYRLRNRAQPDPSFSVILMQPYYPVYNADGSFAIAHQIDDNNNNWDGPISENTIAQTELTHFYERRFRVFGNTFLEVKPLENITIKTSFGGDYNTRFQEFFAPSTIGNYRTPVANNFAQAFESNIRRENYIVENTLHYDNAFRNHNIDVLLGHSYQQESVFNTKVIATDFADDNIPNVGGATSSTAITGRSKWAQESYFSRLQYSYDNKYSFSASYRRDGSSRLGANTRYDNFASLSAGWVLSNEDFFSEEGVVSYAKLRASWGQTGNNQIDNYGSIATIDQNNYTIDGQLVAGNFTNTAPNHDLTWETNSAINLGLDLGLLKNKILLTTEYYKSNTEGLLLQVPVPQQSGFSQSLQNLGKLENRGFELEIKGTDFKFGELTLGFNANLTTNENKVISLGDQERIIVNNGGMNFITKVGGSIGEFYAYDIIGVYRDQSEIDNETITPLAGTEVGDYIVRDANGDGKITADDRVSLGDYNPDFTYGFGFTFNYKNFDLGMQFNGVVERKAADRMVYYAESGEGFFVPTQYYFDNYFNDRNPNGFLRRPDFSSFSSAGRLTRASNLTVLDADYFRLRSLQLGYNFPIKTIKHLQIDNLRVYLTGNNVFNITNYRGYNPDGIDTRSNRTQTLTRGWIQSTSPLTRFWALGLNVKF